MHHISFQLLVQFEEAAVNEDEVDNDFANFENINPDSEDVSYEIGYHNVNNCFQLLVQFGKESAGSEDEVDKYFANFEKFDSDLAHVSEIMIHAIQFLLMMYHIIESVDSICRDGADTPIKP